MSEKQMIENFVFELRHKDSVIIGIAFLNFTERKPTAALKKL